MPDPLTPEVAREHVLEAGLDLSPEAGHHLLFPRWRGILRALQRDAAI